MQVDTRDVEHETLLALAYRAQAEASADDREALVATTRRLLTFLAMHLDNEPKPLHLDGTANEAKTRGAEQVVEQFVNLVREATSDSSSTRRCEQIASRALDQLRQQIVAETPAGEPRGSRNAQGRTVAPSGVAV